MNIEPHGYFTTKPEFMGRMLNFCDSPYLRMNLDTGNAFIAGQDRGVPRRSSSGEPRPRQGRLGVVAAATRGKQTGSPSSHCVMGEGVNAENIEKCLLLSRDHGYKGVLSMECEGQGGPMIERSLEWLRRTLAELNISV